MDKKLIEIVADKLGIREDNLRDITETATMDTLGADSLDRTEVIMDLEEAYGIEISDEKAKELTTLGQLDAYIQAELAKKGREYE